ncbi:MAG: hypothetical protein KKF33_04600, partial [Alphaproteobacteria bacterium]|nr:hypothetical protein [Alphaproteobacteria bacterium]
NIGYRPYWGALKGAEGVLVDRAGNALDRSLLLAALLQHHGHQVRIGHATLDAPVAGQLAQLTSVPLKAAPVALRLTPEILAVFLNEGRLSASEISALATEGEAEGTVLEASISQDLVAVGGLLKEAIDESNITIPDPIASGRWAKMASDFYWAEVMASSGDWTRLETLGIVELAALNFAAADHFDPEALPTELLHRVEAKATLMVQTESGVEERELGTAGLTSIDALGKTLKLANTPLDLGGILGGLPPTDWLSEPGPDDQFAFTIMVGDEVVSSRFYRMSGEVSDLPAESGVQNSLGGGLGRLTNMMNGATEPAGSAEAISVQYVLSDSQGFGQPLQQETITRRLSLEDQPTADAISSGALPGRFWTAKAAVLPARIDEQYEGFLQLQRLSAILGPIKAEAGRMLGVSSDAAASSSALNQSLASTLASMVHQFEANRPELVGKEPFSVKSSLIIEEQAISSDAQQASLLHSIDLARIGEASYAPGPRGLLSNGVLWTWLESQLLARASVGPSSSFGFAAQFNEEADQTLDFAKHIGALPENQNFKHDVDQDVSSGQHIGLLHQSERPIWWSLDPETGMAIGRVVGGRGDALAESGEITIIVTEKATVAAANYELEVKLVFDLTYMIYSFAQCVFTLPAAKVRFADPLGKCVVEMLANGVALGTSGVRGALGISLAVKALNALFQDLL